MTTEQKLDLLPLYMEYWTDLRCKKELFILDWQYYSKQSRRIWFVDDLEWQTQEHKPSQHAQGMAMDMTSPFEPMDFDTWIEFDELPWSTIAVEYLSVTEIMEKFGDTLSSREIEALREHEKKFKKTNK